METQCDICKKAIYNDEDRGVYIDNFAIPNFKQQVRICKACAVNLMVKVMTGGFLGIGKLLGGLQR